MILEQCSDLLKVRLVCVERARKRVREFSWAERGVVIEGTRWRGVASSYRMRECD